FITGTVAVGADANSPYAVTVSASDGTNSGSAMFTWAVSHFTFTNPGNQTEAIGDSAYLPTGGVDPDGDPLTFSASNLPPGLSIDSNSGLITGAISSSATDGMPYAVTLSATDGTNTASQTFDWTVTHVFVVNPGQQQNATGDSVILPINAGDNYGAPVTVTATGLPPGLSVNSVGNIVGTISNTADAGSPYDVFLSATDRTYSTSESFQWIVSRIVLGSPGDPTNADGVTVVLPISATDNQGDALSYTATGLPDGLTIGSSSGVITGTVGAGADSDVPYAVTVTASGGGSSSSVSFQWTVINPITVTPVADQTNALGDAVSLNISATSTMGGTLSYSASGLPDGLTISSSTADISGTVASTASIVTPYDVAVTVGEGAISAGAYFVWTISHLTLADPGDQANLVGDSVSLPLSAVDNYAEGVTFQAQDLPPGLSINSSTGVISGTVSQTAVAGSPYTVTASATGGGYTVSQTFDWTVSRFSIVDPGDQNSADGDTVSLPITVQDNNADTLSYSATDLPGGLSINATTGRVSGVISSTADADGPYSVTVTASDGAGHSASDSFYWSVTQLTLTNPGDQQMAGGVEAQVQLTAQGPDGVPLTFSASGLPQGETVNASTGLISGTIPLGAESATPYTVTVTASDGAGASASQTFNWWVDYICVMNPGNQNYAAGQTVDLPIQAYDNEGNHFTYSASGLPAGLFMSGADIVGTVASSAVSANPYNVVVTVTNTLGQIGTAAFAVNVADYTVTFSPSPVYAGYLKDKDNNPLPLPNAPTVTATVSDPTKVGNIQLKPGGQTPDRISLGQAKIDKDKGTITVPVNGQSATPATPGQPPKADTTIVANDPANSSVNVFVVVPRGIKSTDHPQPSGTLAGENLVLDATTSPAFFGLAPNHKLLATFYGFRLSVQVVDQFGNNLNAVYQGVNVSEAGMINDKTEIFPINQQMNGNGQYTDRTGFILKYQDVDFSTQAGQAQADAWPKNPEKKILTKDEKEPASPEVYVGGFHLLPGLVNRFVIYKYKEDIVSIQWPNN
ncbi:MAG TPA: putative Ig domain-containing protein, partial [Gemmataceae bacterium]|nr:putative Ig domain-containing protein [Gemmataceae bacterium]